jgi:hypothetical protein
VTLPQFTMQEPFGSTAKAESRRFQEKLAALQWRPITAQDLPKVGESCFGSCSLSRFCSASGLTTLPLIRYGLAGPALTGCSGSWSESSAGQSSALW